ncbi:alcohol dehydrogenase catalytic domain-containing protein [Nocardia sp. NPDC051570]|uniref:alcohol dehydrogenase catalytic domain-containing protein n=1 Tax=Nocardia sp. NPDC051570 TaxID=3364324 RepID=UPI0037A14837
MKGVVYQGPYRVEIDAELPMPRVRDARDAVVRVTRTAICGSDLHPYRGEMPDFAPGTVLGHEFAGVVAAVGADVPFAVGDRVFASDLVACGRCPACARDWHYHCDNASLFGYSTIVGPAVAGGQAEYVRVPFADIVLARSPEDLTDEQVLFAGDVLTTGYAAAADAGIGSGDTVGVVGAGPVGVLAAQCAQALGAGAVIVSDPDPARRAMAESVGIAAVAPDDFGRALDAVSDGWGARAVLEAVGTDAALLCALRSVGPRGTVVAAGAHSAAAMPFPSGLAFTRELTIRFTVGDPIRHRDQALGLIRSGLVDPARIISHRLPLSQARRGYELFDRRAAFKVVLLADGDIGSNGNTRISEGDVR